LDLVYKFPLTGVVSFSQLFQQNKKQTIFQTVWRQEHVGGDMTKKGASVKKASFYVQLVRIENREMELAKNKEVGFFVLG
jgi:hypothetical protein